MSKKLDLIEVKKDSCGTGLLIENDGYINPISKPINENINGNDEWHVPYPFIVSAVFQKFGIKNANGRVYPEDVLKREVERYQQKIREKRALGECYTEDAMILTYHGWKNITEVQEGELILTLNVETNEIEIKPIIRKIEYDYDDDIIHIQNRNINDYVTPNHKYPIYDRNNKFKGFFTANDIFKTNIPDFSHNYIPKQGIWNENGDEYYILKGIENPNSQLLRLHPQIVEDKKIKMSTMMKFLGIYLSEGCLNTEKTIVSIFQKKQEIINDIKNLMIELDLEYSVIENENITIFNIYDKRLALLLEPLGKCYTKYIPTYFKQQSKENLALLYEWFVKGDGRIRGDKRRTTSLSLTDDVFSTSKQLILDLNEIQLKIGYSGNFHYEKHDNDRYINGRLIEGKNCQPMYFTLRSLTKGVTLDKRFLKTTKEHYHGKVYCVEVENHTWYVMQNDKCHWTGNCNHPSESTIDLGRISHNIVELHWEGSTLVGKLEIFTSHGFRKYGIVSTLGDMVANHILSGYKIGVSSRAVGSVEEKLGVLMVGDDLELICWDVVADPSTPNAWIYTDENEKQAYVESKKNDEKKPILSEKINKIQNILLK